MGTQNQQRNILIRNILIIGNDQKLNEGIVLALANDTYTFLQCSTAADAGKIMESGDISLILLDIQLPDGNGVDFVRAIRKYSQVPLLLIAENNMELDIEAGLEAGADDYIIKPFSLTVLRARVAVWLRGKTTPADHFKIDHFDFDFGRMEFRRSGQLMELDKTEQRLLKILCENKGATVKRDTLVDWVWQGIGECLDKDALTVAVKRLRDQLEIDSANPDYIKNVYGIGYTWAVSP